MITPYNILRHELIGLKAEVVDRRGKLAIFPRRLGNATADGYKISGTVVDETRNTLKINTKKGIKTVPKDCVVVDFTLPGGAVVRIDGKLLVARPEERTKKEYRIKF